MSRQTALEQLREQIDEIDASLLDLLNQRADRAREIAEAKRNESPDDPVYCPDREAQVLRRLSGRNCGPLGDGEVTSIFREVMSACLALEQCPEIGFLGPEGTFTHQAALKHFGHSARFTSLGSISEVFRETEAGTAKYGVVPVENSSEGSVGYTHDLLLDSPLLVVGEVELRIRHCLLGSTEDLSGVKTVYSHQQSFQQCRGWLQAHLPTCEQVNVNSTADVACYARDDSGAGIIAGAGVADLYGLQVIARNIEDASGNTTRFLVLGKHPVAPSGADKTSILFSVRNRPGALVHLLQALSEHGVSMTRIESRPARQANWQYVFFIDVEGHRQDEVVQVALAQLERQASFFKWLGSYPKAA